MPAVHAEIGGEWPAEGSDFRTFLADFVPSLPEVGSLLDLVYGQQASPYNGLHRIRFRQVGGAPGEVRTHDLQLRRLSLYPSELRAHLAFRRQGVETLSRETGGVLDYFNAWAACTPQRFRVFPAEACLVLGLGSFRVKGLSEFSLLRGF